LSTGPVAWNIGAKSSKETVGQLVDFRSAVKKIVPSVVSVDRLERIQNYWSNEVAVAATGTGSGVIVSKEGYILTNNHVVENADSVQVRLGDKRTFKAKVVGTDPRSDIAVIKIDAPNLQPAELGTSSDLEVGEWVIAVGNPLGYENTVSAGVVSSLKRTLSAGENQTILVDAIQTDAAINQGNSGGALCNSRGQVIGINSAIASNTGGSIGIGFAIPIDRARRVSDDIVKFGHVKYGVLGVETLSRPGLLKIASVREELAQRIGSQPPEDGVVIRQVIPGSPAAGAGIQPLDILTEIDGKKISEPADFAIAMVDKRPGDVVKVRYWSKGSVKNVTATLKEQ
jgi:S1-C subfamily serine protease